MVNTFYKLKMSNLELTIESLRGFINTHYVELTTNPDCNVVQLYNEWAEVNLQLPNKEKVHIFRYNN